MKRNFFTKVMTGLILQACFFSTTLIAETYWSYYDQAPGLQFKTSWMEACTTAIENYKSVKPFHHSYIAEGEPSCTYWYSAFAGDGLNPVAYDCPLGQAPDTGGICQTQVDACAGQTNSMMLTVSQDMMSLATDGVFDVGGCGYVLSTVQCIDENTCLGVATGSGVTVTNGVTCDNLCQTEAQGTATIQLPLTFRIAKEAYKNIQNSYNETLNPDGSTTSTSTKITTEVNDAWDNITYDGEYYNELTNAGTTTTTTETTVTTTNTDGTSSTTTSTDVSTSSGDLDSKTTNATTGATTTSDGTPVVTDTNETTTTERDALGDITTEETITDELFEDPNPQDCGYGDFPDCKINESNTPTGEGENPLSDGVSGQGLIDQDGLLQGIAGTDSGVSSLTMPNLLPSSSLCQKINITLFGFSGEFPSASGCDKLQVLKLILGYFFYVLTVIFIFSTTMNAGTKV